MRLKDFLKLTNIELLKYLNEIGFNAIKASERVMKGESIYNVLEITDIYSQDIKIIKKNNKKSMFFCLLPSRDCGTIEVVTSGEAPSGTIYIYYNSFGVPKVCSMVMRKCDQVYKIHSIKEMLG